MRFPASRIWKPVLNQGKSCERASARRAPFFALLAFGELLRADPFLRFDVANGRRFEPVVLVEGREPPPYVNRLPLSKPCSRQK